MAKQLAFEDASGGMNASDPPHKIATNQLARMVNCAIDERLPTTRPGIRMIPLEGVPVELVERGNIQGSKFFNPAKGQGGIILSKDGPQIALAVQGRKFVTRIKGRHGSTVAEVEEITNQRLTNPSLHLVWWGAWENLLLANDGVANCFIWDGVKPAFFSKGYNTVQKRRSRVPNAGTILAYAHGRGVVVSQKRVVLVGDSLHRTSQTTSDNLLEFIDQTYWATGTFFLPPSQMGDITAAEILPTRNTQHGHGDLMMHCEDGIFSIDLNVFPRSAWSATPMVRHALLDCGAVGPYAIDIYDGNQIFRSRKGIQLLRSAAGEQMEGDPFQPLSTGVHTWLDGDYPRYLRFASCKLWDSGNRFFCTIGPEVGGRYRSHRGIVVRNIDPDITHPNTPAAWEGLWTFPPECRGIVQLIGGLFDGDERVFAWCRGDDGRNRLVEFTTTLREDVLLDGTRRRISAFAITRAIDAGKWWMRREYTEAKLYLSKVEGELDWGVWFRPSESPKWTFLNRGTLTVPAGCDIASDLPQSYAPSHAISLGRIPSDIDGVSGLLKSDARGIQFLVRWRGYCQFQGIRVTHGDADVDVDDVSESVLNKNFVRASEFTDDFEYSKTTVPEWIEP